MKKIVGFDEAGRGPLAGPVCAGAVILPCSFPIEILGDSKKLSKKRREQAETFIKKKALWGFAFVDHKTIDKINILRASLLAMRLAFFDMMSRAKDFCQTCNENENEFAFENFTGVVDGLYIPDVPIKCCAVTKADSIIPQVMAASIIAKTGRDFIMQKMDLLYPEYGYKKHKGYPTKAHKDACKKFGPSPIQRLSFKY